MTSRVTNSVTVTPSLKGSGKGSANPSRMGSAIPSREGFAVRAPDRRPADSPPSSLPLFAPAPCEVHSIGCRCAPHSAVSLRRSAGMHRSMIRSLLAQLLDRRCLCRSAPVFEN